jgi:transcription termination factor NusB
MENDQPAISRNQLNTQIMSIIYQALCLEAYNVEYDLGAIMCDVCEVSYPQLSFYVREICIKTMVNKDHIISLITPFLIKWTFKRLPLIIQAILLLSVGHHLYSSEKTPKPVIINIAIKLAKAYGDTGQTNDYKMVNAILERVIHA